MGGKSVWREGLRATLRGRNIGILPRLNFNTELLRPTRALSKRIAYNDETASLSLRTAFAVITDSQKLKLGVNNGNAQKRCSEVLFPQH